MEIVKHIKRRFIYSKLFIIVSIILSFQIYAFVNTHLKMQYIHNTELSTESLLKIKPVKEISKKKDYVDILKLKNPFDPGKHRKYLGSQSVTKRKFEYKLTAILIEGKERVALLVNNKNQSLTVKKGDIVKGWKVISIKENSITLTYNGTSLKLNLW